MAGEVSFTPSEGDYLAANRDWFFRALRRPRSLVIAGGAVILVGLMGGLSELVDGDPSAAPLTGAGFCLFALMGFGGAGPATVARVARQLGMRQAMIPPASGLASALGLLVAPPGFEFGHSLAGEAHRPRMGRRRGTHAQNGR